MSNSRVKIPFSVALRMIGDYAGTRLLEQVRSVAFIVIYLVVFQLLVFGTPPDQALRVAGGIGMVVFGLAFFLEGLFLGLMPLGDRVGIQLPIQGGLAMLIPFGLLLGLGSTLAEPAVAALRVVGGDLAAWEAPVLFYLLERNPQLLIIAIGVGVGIAVAIGMVRFYVGFSIKPLILIIIPVLLILSLILSYSDKLSAILGLAWDAGAVTTGAVTVPLVLALGIGVSRSSGKGEKSGSGFGIVMLASAFPVLGVMVLGMLLAPQLPKPTAERDFFSAANRSQAMLLFEDEEDFRSYALIHGSEKTQKTLLDEDNLEANDRLRHFREGMFDDSAHKRVMMIIREEMVPAARSVLPLTALLSAVLFLLLRDRPRHLDEVLLGIAFALLGMSLLTAGIRIGLSPLGNEAGRRLPKIFTGMEVEQERIVIEDFDPALLFPAAGPSQKHVKFFHLYDGKTVETVEYRPEWHDPDQRIYTHRISASPLIHPDLSRIGLLLILLFAFGIGFGTTIAEPALNALGRTVEDITVSTIKGVSVVRAVSIGVGLGLVIGVVRIIYAVPVVWVLLPPYLLLLPLTILSEEDFTGIAWDSGGVTTGAVTVPLVLALGVGLGTEMEIADSFGILAMASVYPIVTVLLFGFFVRLRQRNIVRAAEAEGERE